MTTKIFIANMGPEAVMVRGYRPTEGNTNVLDDWDILPAGEVRGFCVHKNRELVITEEVRKSGV